MTAPLSPFKRRLMVAAGFACLLLGALGILIPVLPTTPFLLLAAGLFLRSSTRLYQWITAHRVFGPFILNYRLYRAVPRRSKIAAIVLLWLTIGSSILWAVDAWWLRALLLVVAVAVTLHLARMKVLTPAMLAEVAGRRAAETAALPADPAVE
jgi:hypothetical protein